MLNGRFKTWQGHLIGLSIWQHPHRYNIASAFRKLLPTITEPIATSLVQEYMQNMLERPISRLKVSSLLSNSPAQYDSSIDKWVVPDSNDVDPSESEYDQVISKVQGGCIL